MKVFKTALLAAAGLVVAVAGAEAKTVKLGVVLTFSGGLAQLGEQVERGMMLYYNLHKDELGEHDIEFIKRDSQNPGGQVASRMVQELITREDVDMLAGFIFSPNAMNSAELFTAAKKPAIIMNAGTSFIPSLSPYIARTSFTMWQSGYIMGKYAAEELGHETAVSGYTDYPPGKDSVAAFKKGFEDAGGQVLDEIPMGGPGEVPDFTPFLQRAKDQNPDAFYVFVPAGNHTSAVVNTFDNLGMKSAGIKLIGPGDITQDTKLNDMGESAVGMVTTHHYGAHDIRPANQEFVAAWKEAYGQDSTPDFMAVGGYDGMAAIFHVIKTLDGEIDGDAAMEALKGFTFNESPRGVMMIDPDTRDVVHNEYVREVQMTADGLSTGILATFEMVKDPCKEFKIGPCAK